MQPVEKAAGGTEEELQWQGLWNGNLEEKTKLPLISSVYKV